jgi:hypothetical protein
MTLPRTVAEVVAEHVVFQVECIDRMYLNVVTIQPAAGIQTLPLVSSVRTSKGRRPCLAAVDR